MSVGCQTTCELLKMTLCWSMQSARWGTCTALLPCGINKRQRHLIGQEGEFGQMTIVAVFRGFPSSHLKVVFGVVVGFQIEHLSLALQVIGYTCTHTQIH